MSFGRRTKARQQKLAQEGFPDSPNEDAAILPRLPEDSVATSDVSKLLQSVSDGEVELDNDPT